MFDTDKQLWLDNLEKYTANLRDANNQRNENRRIVSMGSVQQNYCDICGAETRVYTFYCMGDEAAHMYCVSCAKAVINALEVFIGDSN